MDVGDCLITIKNTQQGTKMKESDSLCRWWIIILINNE